MTRPSKRVVEAAEIRARDYIIWDNHLPSFGLRISPAGRRTYLVQYRALGRSRRYTIGAHGVWTAELARKEALSLLGQVARGDNPAEDRELDRKAITMKQLCERYLDDLGNGLILGKGNRPKRPSTKITDTGRINRHIIPLVGTRRVESTSRQQSSGAGQSCVAGQAPQPGRSGCSVEF